ncbi:MAG: helical backbone metal receptor [Actinomycetota bacterium]
MEPPLRRVVSLVPSSTETLLALGADVVACTRFCEQPEIRHVGGTKNPDIDAIVELAPDVVALDREENRIEDHDALLARGVHVVVTDVRDVDTALAAVELLADAAGVSRPEWVATADAALTAPVTTDRHTAFVPIWRRPWMTIGPDTYGADVLARLGIDVIAAPDSTGDYPEVDLDVIAGVSPDLVLVPSEPYVFRDVHLDELRQAIPAADVRRVDGQDLFWWGTRTVDALTRLSRAVEHRPSE